MGKLAELEETKKMSKKRDREEKEMRCNKVQRLCNEKLRVEKMLKDMEYFKYNIPPSWEELKEKQENAKSWDMSDMSDAIKEMNSKTLPSLDKLKKRHEMLQAKLLEREEK